MAERGIGSTLPTLANMATPRRRASTKALSIEVSDEPFGDEFAGVAPRARSGSTPTSGLERTRTTPPATSTGVVRTPWAEPDDARRRSVSVRGTETLAELDALHEMASQRRKRRLQRHQSLALNIWDGHHDLVPRRARLISTSTVGSDSDDEAADDDAQGGEGWLSSLPALSLGLVVAGCCCQLPYELLNTSDRGCGCLTSTCEAVFGLALTAPTALRQEAWTVPVRTHLLLAAAAVLYPLLLNQAMASPLPVVLLSTLKNGNLVANAIVGAALLGKRYSAAQMLSVALVSLGLVMSALGGTVSDTADEKGDEERGDVAFGLDGMIAVACLAGALFSRALTGGLQEAAFARCEGRAPAEEMLFFRDAFGLPVLLVRGVVLAQGDELHGARCTRTRGGAAASDGVHRARQASAHTRPTGGARTCWAGSGRGPLSLGCCSSTWSPAMRVSCSARESSPTAPVDRCTRRWCCGSRPSIRPSDAPNMLALGAGRSKSLWRSSLRCCSSRRTPRGCGHP